MWTMNVERLRQRMMQVDAKRQEARAKLQAAEAEAREAAQAYADIDAVYRTMVTQWATQEPQDAYADPMPPAYTIPNNRNW